MAIVKLKQAILFGSGKRQDEVLTKLQDFGKVHVVMAEEGKVAGERELSMLKEVMEAIRSLENCPKKIKQAELTASVKPQKIVKEILTLKENQTRLKDQKLQIERDLAALRPWGQFDARQLEKDMGRKLFHYVLDRKDEKILQQLALPMKVVGAASTHHYVVVVAEDKPDITLEPEVLSEIPYNELLLQLEDINEQIDRNFAERMQYTRYIDLLKEYVQFVEDHSQHTSAGKSITNEENFFRLKLYCPEEVVTELGELAASWNAAVLVTDPDPEDLPPTLLKNCVPFSSGEDVMNIYATPGYAEWDPSASIYIAFAIFYAMIVGDAGYGLIFLALTLVFRSAMKKSDAGNRLYRLMMTLSFTTIAYGAVTGSWFAIELPKNFFLAKLSLINPVASENLVTMMTISILIGCIHIIVANIISAKNAFPKFSFLGHLGWIPTIAGGFIYWQFSLLRTDYPTLTNASMGMIATGLAIVFLFSSDSHKPVARFLDGLLALTKLSGVFGDILSYLRLFALGLASAYMGVTFNMLAGQAGEIAGFGWIIALVILLIGHGINIVLCIMGGVIHGLRLNFIEFYNWSLEGDGFLFRPFKRKGVKIWN